MPGSLIKQSAWCARCCAGAAAWRSRAPGGTAWRVCGSPAIVIISKQMFIMKARGCDIYWMTMAAAHASHSHSLGIISLLQHRIIYIYINWK